MDIFLVLYHRLESILFIFKFVYKMDNIIEYGHFLIFYFYHLAIK